MSKARLEAFSDGVIAVAITLLVLNIRVPPPNSTASLGHALATQWPSYAAYVTSFTTIGIIWINHHAMIGRLRAPDHAVLIMNILLLLWIGVLPFATDLMASYLKEAQGENLAAALYSGAFLIMSISFAALNRLILFERPHLLAVEIPEARRRQILRRSVVGLIPYALATALAFLSPYITLAICAGVAAFYATPLATGGEES